MPRQSTIFGGGGGDVTYGNWPNWLSNPSIVLTAGERLSNQIELNMNALSGFLRDGDMFALPFNSGEAVEYFDSSESLLWSVLPSDVEVTATRWAGYFLNVQETLLYVYATKIGAAGVFDIYAATIDITGTIDNIATITPDAFTADATVLDWDANSTQGRADAWPLFGTDNAVIIQGDTGLFEYITFNFLTGAIVTQPTVVAITPGVSVVADHNNFIAQITNGFTGGYVDNPAAAASQTFAGNSPIEVRDKVNLANYIANTDKFINRANQVWRVSTNDTRLIQQWRACLLQDITDANSRILQTFRGNPL